MEQRVHSVNFVVTAMIGEILERAKIYLGAGLPVHFTGAAGTGKTVLALKLAKDLGKPFYLIQGDETFNRNELVGGPFGVFQKVVEDNFIASVSKVERKVMPLWVNNPVTIACREGGTLIYDEFTRARPESNNILLGIISERILPIIDQDGRLVNEEVHPDFKLILTSNPAEYAGVNQAQDALYDRIVSIRLNGYDDETKALITAKQSGISHEQALRIVRFLREIGGIFQLSHFASIRSAIMIAKIIRQRFLSQMDLQFFIRCCQDVLNTPPEAFEKMMVVWEKK